MDFIPGPNNGTMSGNPTNQDRDKPTEQDWENWKPRILQLYASHSCPDVVQILASEGFHATERMCKQRYNKWGSDKKTVKNVEYEAMLMKWEECRGRGEQVEFTVAYGQARKRYAIAEISKHLRRVRQAKREENRTMICQRGFAPFFERRDIQVQRVSSSVPSIFENSSSEIDCSSPESVHNSPPTGRDAWRHGSDAIQPQRIPFDGPMSKLPNINITTAFGRLSYEDFSQPSIEISWVRKYSTTQAQEKQAEDWLYHVFSTSIMHNLSAMERASKHRATSCEYFEQMLRAANPRILTSLFHISMTLSTLGVDENYHNFLDDCCQIIQSVHGLDVSFLTPYRYALACEHKDSVIIARLAEDLQHGIDACCRIFGNGTPNVLVIMHFQASHLLDQVKDAQAAIALLQYCQRQSAEILEEDNLINVNCLALLARAYSVQGNSNAAMMTYGQAAERCKLCLGERHPYRLKMVREYALLQAYSGREDIAENLLREVVSGRVKMLGPGHGHTWGAMQDLERILNRQNRGREYIELRSCIRQAYWDLADGHKFVPPNEAYGLGDYQSPRA